MRRVVVVGYGMAGARFADEVLRRDSSVALTVLGDERHPAYNRVLLSSVVAGSMTADLTRLHDDGWAATHGVDLRLGVDVTGIDRARRVVLVDGDEVSYDALVLATGARSWIPPTEGLREPDGALAPGVVSFRTLDDCARITAAAKAGTPVAVLGGGLLGLEVARGLAGRGCLVTVVHPVGHVMERQLDAAAGRVLARSLGELGIEFRLGSSAEKYLAGDGLWLSDGSLVPAELVVVSAGVRANTAIAVDAGIAVDQGVLVDDALRSSDPRVHAIGDCAQHVGTVTGLVQPAWEQAAVLADRLTGTAPGARYRGTSVVTRLKARDIDVAACGDVHVDLDCPDHEVLSFQDPTRGRYAKLVLRGDLVTGAIVIGVPDAAAAITHLYDRGLAAPSDRLALLLGRASRPDAVGSPVDLPTSAVICRCNTVSKGQLVTAYRAGATTVAALSDATRATTGCGSCKDAVCGLVDWLDLTT